MEFNLLTYINENLIILIPVIYVLGMLFKKSRFRDNLIPWFLLVISCILCSLLGQDIVNGIIQGTLVTGVCVLGNQLYIQTVRNKNE